MNKDIIAPIIFAVGCFSFFMFAIPQYDQILDIQSATTDMEQLLAERTELRKNVENLVGQYESRKTDINKLAFLLPVNEQLDQIVEGIQTTATQSGIQLKSLSAGGDKLSSKESYKKTFIKIEVGGSYDAALNYLKEIEKSLRLYDVSEILFGKSSTASLVSSNAFNIEIKMNAYNIE